MDAMKAAAEQPKPVTADRRGMAEAGVANRA